MRTLTILILFLSSICLLAQDMWTPPKPLDNKMFESMVGTWEGETEMMGKKTNEVIKVYWGPNKQFLFIDLTSTSADGKDKYNGFGIYGINKEGKIVAWWFDDWGTDWMSYGTGTQDGMKTHIISENPMYKDDRITEVKGDEMTMTAVSTWMQNGQEMKIDSKTVYKRKK